MGLPGTSSSNENCKGSSDCSKLVIESEKRHPYSYSSYSRSVAPSNSPATSTPILDSQPRNKCQFSEFWIPEISGHLPDTLTSEQLDSMLSDSGYDDSLYSPSIRIKSNLKKIMTWDNITSPIARLRKRMRGRPSFLEPSSSTKRKLYSRNSNVLLPALIFVISLLTCCLLFVLSFTYFHIGGIISTGKSVTTLTNDPDDPKFREGNIDYPDDPMFRSGSDSEYPDDPKFRDIYLGDEEDDLVKESREIFANAEPINVGKSKKEVKYELKTNDKIVEYYKPEQTRNEDISLHKRMVEKNKISQQKTHFEGEQLRRKLKNEKELYINKIQDREEV